MSEAEPCPMLLLTQADFDGELDAARAQEVAAHRAGCAECQAAWAELGRVRAALAEPALFLRAPPALRSRWRKQTESPSPLRPARLPAWRRPAASFALGAALAAGICLALLQPQPTGLVDQVIDDHIRALQPGHLEDVISTDRHTVKPWFDGKLDFAPPVKDLGDKNFPLLGGRLDYLGGREVAALVYGRDKHLINLFIWPEPGASDAPASVIGRRGYTAIRWHQNGMALWAVSDLEQAQLAEFARLWRAAE